MEDSLQKRFGMKLVANIVAGVINMIIVTIVPKALGPVAFGHFSYLQQFFSQVIAFLDGGTSIAFFTKLSANQERKELIVFYFFFATVLLSILCIFTFILDRQGYLSLLLPEIPTQYIYLGLWFGFLTWFSQVFIKIADAFALTVSVEVIKIIHKLFSLGMLLYVIHEFSFDLSLYFYFHIFSLIAFFILLTLLFTKRKIFSFQLLILRIKFTPLILEIYKFSSSIFVFNIIGIAIGLFDLWLLQHISGSIETGFYGLAYSIAAMCFLFTSAMTPIITREFSKAYENSEIDKIKQLFKKYIPMLYAVSAYFGVFVAFESEILLQLFTDDKFKGASTALAIMAFYPIHQTYGQLSSSLFFATGRTQQYRDVGIISSFIGLVFSFVFIYWLELGAAGFAYKMVFIQIISVNIQLFFNVRFLKIRLRPFIQHQFFLLILFIGLAFISTQYLQFIESLFYQFLLAGIIYSIAVLIIIIKAPYLFRTNKKELTSLKNKVINL